MGARQAAVMIIATVLGGAGACLIGSRAVAAPPDACAMLTQVEVATALGVAVGPGERLMPTDTRFCTWHEHGNDQRRNVRINFITQQQYEVGKTPLPNVVKTTEAGIGDEAYFSKAKGMVFNLSVKKGVTFFRVMARSNAQALVKANDEAIDAQDKDIDRTIARAILKKL